MRTNLKNHAELEKKKKKRKKIKKTIKFKKKTMLRAAWLARLEEHVTLDLGLVGSSPR